MRPAGGLRMKLGTRLQAAFVLVRDSLARVLDLLAGENRTFVPRNGNHKAPPAYRRTEIMLLIA